MNETSCPTEVQTNKPLSENVPLTHTKARTEKPGIYPHRFSVPDDKVAWTTAYPEYQPPYFVAPVVLDNDISKKPGGWADPEDISAAKANRNIISYEGDLSYDDCGRPLNPRGRTGIEGRGLLGKWGPNYAADPIITRNNPETGHLEMVAIRRKDNGQWAIPGGMVDYGERASTTVKRELEEEAGVALDFSGAEEVYRGYVDDPRNTDNAWMETSAFHLHLPTEVAQQLDLQAGDDAQAVQWLEINEENLQNLYASHADLVRKALVESAKE